MIKTVVRRIEGRVKTLQAVAAVAAISAAGYTTIVKPYLAAPKAVTLACSKIVAKDADSIDCDGQELRLIGDGVPGISGVDAPEIKNAKCDAERELGVLAKDVVSSLLPSLRRIEDTGIRDNYRRPLVRLRMKSGTLIETELLRQGLMVIWTPSYVSDWCGEIDTSYNHLTRGDKDG